MKKNDDLRTPDYLIEALHPFDLDVCAGANTNIGKVNYHIGRNEDGLLKNWIGFVWCNPPFSQKEIWIEKMMGPLAEFCRSYFVMGKKVNFIGGPSSNNLGSVLFPFGEQAINRIKYSNLPGHFVEVKYFRPRSF